MALFDFPGEKYLLEDPPDYGSERQMLLVKFFFTFVFWTMLVPFFLASERQVVVGDETAGSKEETVASTTTTTKLSSRTIRKTTTTTTIKVQRKTQKKSAKSRANKKNESKQSQNNNVRSTDTEKSNTSSTVRVVDGITNTICIVAFILHVIYILLTASPDNYYTSRTVFETPLFSQAESDHLVEMAERVARKNYDMAKKFVKTNRDEIKNGTDSSTIEGYLKEPYGWQKTRHKFHPTTDLNLVTDNFSDEDRSWIQQRLDARLSPTLERIYGVPPSAIRANDMFLVRYDGDRQASLSRHTDSGSITFQTLLSYGFEGGGTRYWNRATLDDNGNPGAPFTYVLPKAGMMTTFPGIIEHEGVQTTKGRRYLLIGFLAVDKIDPWTHRSTDLSWFASWGSLNWASTKFKEGVTATWKDKDEIMEQSDANSVLHSDQVGEIFSFLYKSLVSVCDNIFPHRFAVLVNETSADDYLRDLDEAYELKHQSSASSHSPNHQRSSWFAGQQISVNIDGTLRRNWKTRQDAEDKFDGLS